jgi:hypothetical protein
MGRLMLVKTAVEELTHLDKNGTGLNQGTVIISSLF